MGEGVIRGMYANEEFESARRKGHLREHFLDFRKHVVDRRVRGNALETLLLGKVPVKT